ncbi:hypothetical protein CHARACLAT_029720 [Characodon lateralis]|uniref:Uncharacterized protein n=1 Tax=Characodon lateralis TaxID=208331 RepID=A0ABU7DDH1_9TELE|nr:hypothetical protein [Characodon lateralis]
MHRISTLPSYHYHRMNLGGQRLTPQHLRTAGLLQKPVAAPEQAEEIQDVDDDITVHEPDMTGIVVPSVKCPPSGQNIDRLRATLDVTGPSQSYGRDIYLNVLHFVHNHTS